jgi:hypothetical protein
MTGRVEDGLEITQNKKGSVQVDLGKIDKIQKPTQISLDSIGGATSKNWSRRVSIVQPWRIGPGWTKSVLAER